MIQSIYKQQERILPFLCGVGYKKNSYIVRLYIVINKLKKDVKPNESSSQKSSMRLLAMSWPMNRAVTVSGFSLLQRSLMSQGTYAFSISDSIYTGNLSCMSITGSFVLIRALNFDHMHIIDLWD